LYYSYDTCAGANRNIDEDAFAFYLMENFGIGRSAPLRAVIPWSLPPMHFKRDPSSGRPHEGLDDLYEDDRIPWHGIYVDYFDTMLLSCTLRRKKSRGTPSVWNTPRRDKRHTHMTTRKGNKNARCVVRGDQNMREEGARRIPPLEST